MKRRFFLITVLVTLLGAGLFAVLRAQPAQQPSTVPRNAPAAVAPPDPIAWWTIGWQNVADPFPEADPPAIRIDGLTAGDGVVVGWGRVAAPGLNQFNDMGAVFTSTDGLRWRAIALDDGVAATDTSEPSGVAIGPLGMLAYGGVCCELEEQAVWRSIDGLQWTRVPAGPGFGRHGGTIVRVVGLQTGWVAVGGQGQQAAIWTSADGSNWQAADPAIAGLGKGNVSDVAITATGVIAVGTIDDAAGTHDGAIWTSQKGVEWKRVAVADPTLTGPDETELWRVVPHAGGLFLVGNFGTHQERVRCEQLTGALASLEGGPPPETALSCGWGREHHWLSADGSAWVRLPPIDPLPGQPPNPGQHPIEFRLLGAGGPGLVNLGEDSVPPDGDVRVWVSEDGNQWQAVDGPMPAPGPAQAAVFIGRRILVVRDPVSIAIGQVP